MTSPDSSPGAPRAPRLPRHPREADRENDATRVDLRRGFGAAAPTRSLTPEPAITRRLPAVQRIGRFEIVEKVGEGGMGVVYRARDTRTRQEVALKVLRAHIAYDNDAQTRLAREVQTLERVHHPNVAAVIDADPWGERPYIATEFIPGVPLDAVVAADGTFGAEQLARLGRDLASAIEAIHAAGVVHRDLKPSNVLMVEGKPVVIDFGIAHIADDARLTSTGLVMGTPGYLSPELVEGAPVSDSTDWWGWAATLAFAAQGESPFGRGHMSVVLDRVTRGQANLSGVDPRLRPLLAAALSPVPQDRPSARQVLDQMERYARGESTTIVPIRSVVTPPTAMMPPARPPKQYVRSRSSTERSGVAPDPAQLALPPRLATGPVSGSSNRVRPQSRPGEHDPRLQLAHRSGTLQALFLAWAGIMAVAPVLGLILLFVWNVAARFTDSTVTQTVLRRYEAGRRRSDGAVAVVSAPWHAVRAVVGTVSAAVLPAVVFAAVDGIVGIGWAELRGGVPASCWAIPIVPAAIAAQWVMWRGAGSTTYRRGARSLVRGALPGVSATRAAVALLILIAAVCALGALNARGAMTWSPLTGGFSDPLSEYLPNIGSGN